jgi:hypothetical protein
MKNGGGQRKPTNHSQTATKGEGWRPTAPPLPHAIPNSRAQKFDDQGHRSNRHHEALWRRNILNPVPPSSSPPPPHASKTKYSTRHDLTSVRNAEARFRSPTNHKTATKVLILGPR